MLKRELQILASSILYFSRLPVPFKVPYNRDYQNLVLTWFPLVGTIVGAIGAAVFYGLSLFLPHGICVVFLLAAMVLLTGAFHEDGFADVCDAFGGGYTKEQRMTIMKDSRIGAYAGIGIVLLFAFKIATLIEIETVSIVFVIIASQSLSRWPLLLMAKIWPYARKTNDSKAVDSSKPLSVFRIAVAFILAIVPLFLFKTYLVFVAIPLLVVVTTIFGLWFNKKIGGYTGDCLGAVQQVNEIAFFVFCLALQFNGILLV